MNRTFESYDPVMIGKSIQNWWRALCDKSFTPYDPAYMPQQQALTLGFLCNATCQSHGSKATADFLNLLNMDAQFTGLAVEQMCMTQYENFATADTFEQIGA